MPTKSLWVKGKLMIPQYLVQRYAGCKSQKMPIFRYPLILISLFLYCTGCSQQHFVKVDPALPVSRSDLGQNTSLGLTVIDSRPSNLISKWKGKFNFRRFRITPEQDLADVLHAKIATGLQKKGFTPKRFPSQNIKVLKVEILQLKSIYDENGPNLGVKVGAVLRAHCNNKDQTYRREYRERLTRNPIAPTSFPNETLVNASLSGALKKMFSDDQLLKCLAP